MTAPGAGIDVDLDALHHHHLDVRQFVGQIDRAAGAARSAGALGDGCFGVIGQVMAFAVQAWVTDATASVDKVARAGHAVADGLGDTHALYRDAEDANSAGFAETRLRPASDGNPLVATRQSSGNRAFRGFDSSDDGFAGSGVFGDAQATVSDTTGGRAGVFGMATDIGTNGLDLLGAVMDPLGALASAGVGWLVEHVSFLHEALDKLAGDPAAITAHAQTWENVSTSLRRTADRYRNSATKLDAVWNCVAGQAYQASALGYHAAIRGAAWHAHNASIAMNAAAGAVGVERGLIRDMISSFVGELIGKAIAALASSWFTFGGSIAAFIADTIAEGAALAGRIGGRIARLIRKLAKVAEEFGASGKRLTELAAALDKAGTRIEHAGTVAARSIRRLVPDEGTSLKQHLADLKKAGSDWYKYSYQETWRNHLDSLGEKIKVDKISDTIANKATESSALDFNNYIHGNPHPWTSADSVKAGSTIIGGVNSQLDTYSNIQETYDKKRRKQPEHDQDSG